MTQKDVEQIVSSEIFSFRDAALLDYTKSIMVSPIEKKLEYEWVTPSEIFMSWIACDMRERNVAVAYACGGFAETGYPWGLILKDRNNSGPPNQWYKTLEHCIADYGPC